MKLKRVQVYATSTGWPAPGDTITDTDGKVWVILPGAGYSQTATARWQYAVVQKRTSVRVEGK